MEKIERVLQVSPVRAKAHKPALTALPVNQQIKVLIRNQVKARKMLALEIAKVQHHAAFDVESRDYYEYIY